MFAEIGFVLVFLLYSCMALLISVITWPCVMVKYYNNYEKYPFGGIIAGILIPIITHLHPVTGLSVFCLIILWLFRYVNQLD